MRRKASHKVSHPSTSLGCLQLSDQHITIQKSEALEKSVHAEQKPLLNSRGFFKSKKRPQLLSVTFRPGFDGGGVVGAKVDGFTQMNGARNAMKPLNKYGFWQTKWKNLGEKKKARAAQQLQRARGVCVKKESRLKWRFSLAVYLDKTKRTGELIRYTTLRPPLHCCQDYRYRNK